MAFSLSLHTSSRAMGRYGCPFGFFVLLDFLPKVSLGAVMIHQEVPQPFQRNHFVGVAFEDGGARHAAHHTTLFALRDSHAAGGFKCAEPLGAVFTHAGHQNAHGHQPEFLGDGMEKYICGGTMAVDGWTIRENHHVATRHAAHHDVAIAWADENAAREEKITGARDRKSTRLNSSHGSISY